LTAASPREDHDGMDGVTQANREAWEAASHKHVREYYDLLAQAAAGWWAWAYVLFTGIYGTAWVAGSIVVDVLADASVSGLGAFCMARDPAAIRLIWMVRTRSGPPAPQPAGGTARFRQLGSNPGQARYQLV
jgi:hypothetical protein